MAALLIEWKILDLFEKIKSPFMDYLNYFLTTILGGITLVVIMFVTYWIINKETGRRLGLGLVVSMSLNNLLKGLIMRKRPFEHEGKEYLRSLSDTSLSDGATGSSFPSGHSQNAASLYSGLFINYKGKNQFVRILLICLIVTIALTRLYLGVHFPSDVLVGVTLGVLVTIGLNKLYDVLKDKVDIMFLVLAIFFLVCLFFGLEKDGMKSIGMLEGYVIGNLLEKRFVKFNDTKNTKHRIIRILIGLVIVGGFYLVYSLIPDPIHSNYFFVFVMHFLIAFGGFFLAPLVFNKIENKKNK